MHKLHKEYDADRIIVEVNNGGDLVETVGLRLSLCRVGDDGLTFKTKIRTIQRISEKSIQNTLKNKDFGVLCLFSAGAMICCKCR